MSDNRIVNIDRRNKGINIWISLEDISDLAERHTNTKCRHMTDEQIKIEIDKKNDQIGILKDDIKNLEAQWIANSPIQVGDKIKITNTDYRKQEYSNTGIVKSIDPCRYGDYLVYNCLPLKKDGTMAKVGLFYNNDRSTIEKL